MKRNKQKILGYILIYLSLITPIIVSIIAEIYPLAWVFFVLTCIFTFINGLYLAFKDW